MTSKQRVFSRGNDINYHDYTQNKNGIELLKNAKNKCDNKVLNKFINYNQFLTMTKSYYKYLFENKCIMTPPKNLYDSNNSYICYKKYIDHISTCDDCNNAYDIVNNKCKEIKNVIYPYGLYPTDQNKKIYYPNTIDLKCWCYDTQFNKPLCIYNNNNNTKKSDYKNTDWNYYNSEDNTGNDYNNFNNHHDNNKNNNNNCDNCNKKINKNMNKNLNVDEDLCKTRKKLFI